MPTAAMNAFLACFVAISGLASDPQSLVPKPTQGKVFTYAMEMVIDVQQSRLRVNTDITEKVVKVEANGNYSISSSTKNTKVKVDEDDPVDSENTPESVQTYDSRGKLISSTDVDDNDPSVFDILSASLRFSPPEKPVSVGDKWVENVEPDDKKGIVGYRTEFEFSGTDKEEGEDVWVVRFHAEEKKGTEPLKTDGKFYLSTKDFWLVGCELNATNLKMSPDSPMGTARVRLRRRSSL